MSNGFLPREHHDGQREDHDDEQRERVFFTEETSGGAPVIVERAARG